MTNGKPRSGVLRSEAARLLGQAALPIACAAVVAFPFVRWQGAKTPPANEFIPKDAIEFGTSVSDVGGGARVGMIVFSDFQCPYCAGLALDELKIIRKEFVETGKLVLGFRNFPLLTVHPRARHAAEFAECAGRQGQFWTIHDWLFEAAPGLTSQRMTRLARETGLNEEKLERCIQAEGAKVVDEDLTVGTTLHIEGTPTTFLGFITSDRRLRATERFGGRSAGLIAATRQLIAGAETR